MPLSLMALTRAWMRATTSLALPPRIIMTTPPTDSVTPFLTTAPARAAVPIFTSATSRRVSGVPPTSLSTMAPMSLMSRTRPTPRIRYCSAKCGSTPPPELALLAASASNTCCTVTLWWRSRSGLTSTWYCFS